MTYTPEESAGSCLNSLLEAQAALAAAQVEISAAISTVKMFQGNFRQGFYVEKEPDYGGMTLTTSEMQDLIDAKD